MLAAAGEGAAFAQCENGIRKFRYFQWSTGYVGKRCDDYEACCDLLKVHDGIDYAARLSCRVSV